VSHRVDGAFEPLIPIASHPAVRALAEALRARTRVVATGASGSSTTLVSAAVARELARPVVLVTAHLDDADESTDELASLGVPAIVLPALEVLPGESGVSAELAGRRLAAARACLGLSDEASPVILAPVQALMQRLPPAGELADLARRLRRGDESDPTDLLHWLVGLGYRRVDAVEEPGDVALRGGILDVFPAAGAVVRRGGSRPSRASRSAWTSSATRSSRLSEIDPDTMGSDRALDAVGVVHRRRVPPHAQRRGRVRARPRPRSHGRS
jgi:transcription-repair coupling factor (superfamily II helicase)